MPLLDSIGNKAGGLGSIVSAMGCGACFPALASFGSAIGLGFSEPVRRLVHHGTTAAFRWAGPSG